MGRKPQDVIPQRALAVRLRTTIDLAQGDGRAWRSVDRLVRQNPRASVSTHVLHNLGVARVRALRGRRLFSSLYDARPDSLRAHGEPRPDSLVPLGRDAFDSLSSAERAIVGNPEDYDWENPITIPESQSVRRKNFREAPDSRATRPDVDD